MRDALDMQVQRIEVNGTRLAYVGTGAGEPVVFVHGVLNDLRSWTKQFEVFGPRYRSVAMSCRDYPNTPPGRASSCGKC